jgi:hypothetical protein
MVDMSGHIAPAWHRFLQKIAPNPQAVQAQTLKHSPYVFTAPSNGSLVVSGGAVSKITLTRGRVAVDVGQTSGHLPASLGDVFSISYSSAPLVHFLPG